MDILISNTIFYYFYFTLIFIGLLYLIKILLNIEQNILEIFFHIIIAIFIGIVIKKVQINIFQEITSSFWKFSIVISIFLFILFIKDIIKFKNLSPIISNICKVLYLLSLTNLIASISSDNIILIFSHIYLTTLFWGGFNYKHKEQVHIKNEKLDVPITERSDLFPTRDKELQRTLNQLKTIDKLDTFAIAINGSWGVGKSSFVNVLKQELKKENEIIFIQPMILDNREKLLTYLFTQLENCLNKNGIYTGKGSSYRHYFDLILKFVNHKGIVNLTAFFDVFAEEETNDLRTAKEALEENLSTFDKRIFIIIDDLDRVEKSTIFDILTFIKEIIDLKGISVLFLVDFTKIVDDTITMEYLEKFINLKIDLLQVDNKEIFNHYFQKLINENESDLDLIKYEKEAIQTNNSIYIEDIITRISNVMDSIEKDIENLKEKPKSQEDESEKLLQIYQNKRNTLDKQLKSLKNNLSNPRFAKKIVLIAKEIFEYINDDLKKKNQTSLSINNEINISCIVLNLSIFKVLFKEEYSEIMKFNNISDYLDSLEDATFFKKILDIGDLAFTEIKLIISQYKLEFINSIIFSNALSNELFEEIKLQREKFLEILHKISNIEETKYDFDEVEIFLDSVNYYTLNSEDVVYSNIINKFALLAITSIKKELFTLSKYIYLIDSSFRRFNATGLGNNKKNYYIYFKELNRELYAKTLLLESNQEEKQIKHDLKNFKWKILSNIKPHLSMITWMYHFDNIKYSYSSIFNDLKSITKLESINESIANILNLDLQDNTADPFDYFVKLLNHIVENIEEKQSTDDFFIKSFKYNTETIHSLLKLYKEVDTTDNLISTIPLNDQVKFAIPSSQIEVEEITHYINRLSEYVRSNNDINYDHFAYFQYILLNIEGDIKISLSDFTKLKQILNTLEVNSTLFSQFELHYFMLKLSSIKKINLEP